MKFKIPIVIFILTRSLLFSQNNILIGKIIDDKTNEILSYVTVGIEGKGIGTVTNNKGVFNLKLNENINNNDTVIISHIGYVLQKKLVSELQNAQGTISLIPETTILNEIVLNTKAEKAKKIGKSGAGIGLFHWNFYSAYEADVNDRLSKEIGLKFKINKDCSINSLNFNISSNQFKSLKFRLNIYKIKNGFPTETLLNEDIIFEIKDAFLGWYKVDLTPYEIYFEKNIGDIAVTIQWVESVKMNGKSKFFGISAAAASSHTSFYREKAMDKWSKKKINLSFYLDAMCK